MADNGLKRGEAKIEFFSNLEYLKQEFKNGFVVSKALYNKAKLEKNLKLSYEQFNKYFNDVFKNAHNQLKMALKSKNYLKEYQSSTKDKKIENEPLKLKIQTNSKNVFNAKFGKEFKDEDIL
ncbi:hypothetical protein [Campylobacter ureolyticus]|jgi:hypothetical protein|uniref:Uncharacterized protein n=1 Tax=Campylobacter ureolyticus ACS-301-V-Sch3b TaxID=883165 RepID=S3XD55_9BACT|nr:hypothetical protein [Campylobacter ureolyticus]EPH07322.1 hypothetical protein HMPREF9309_01710 [Campylobacter ureolyticus ACS-301-V-Sch3b]MCZ6135586.1 hypothetical protein [Campylobacter ureolyticus]MCZ6150978.1 hypothetical protein [Campylobacter ureolyticus]MCZ6164248.1 hypothetical protein [Campylobacter ureolyticus]MCZ6166226.1 hypothetical protein [Campylobacter ureolyticus]